MQLRWWKVGLLAGPLLFLSGLIVLVAMAWAMRGQLWHTVVFDSTIEALSARDKQAIRVAVLHEDQIVKPAHRLTRYKVKFNRQSASRTTVTGNIIPNQPVDPDGVVSVTKRSGAWVVDFIVVAGS